MALEFIPMKHDSLFKALKVMAYASCAEERVMFARAFLVADTLVNAMQRDDPFKLDASYALVQFKTAADESRSESIRDNSWKERLTVLSKYRSESNQTYFAA